MNPNKDRKNEMADPGDDSTAGMTRVAEAERQRRMDALMAARGIAEAEALDITLTEGLPEPPCNVQGGVDIPTATDFDDEGEDFEQRIVDMIHAIQDARQKRAEVLMVERGISENEALEITFTEELPDVDH